MKYVDKIVLFAAFWSFVAMPALCEGGLLLHACSQHDSTDCGHESGCHDDPCGKFISDKGRPGPRGDAPSWVQPVVASPEPIIDADRIGPARTNWIIDPLLAPHLELHRTLLLQI